MPRLARRLVPALACAPLLAGCGAEREPARDLLAVSPPEGRKPVLYRDAGMRFDAPVNWRLSERPAPAVFAMGSGAGTVSGFAYLRSEPLPAPGEPLIAAKERLLDEVRERDGSFELERARTREVAGAPAIEVRGVQTVSRRRLETRSVHIFRDGVEYVLEAIAPPRQFRLVDRQVFSPLLRSLGVTGDLGGERLRDERRRLRRQEG